MEGEENVRDADPLDVTLRGRQRGGGLTATPGGGKGDEDVLVAADGAAEGRVIHRLHCRRRLLGYLGSEAGLFGNEGLEGFEIPAAAVVLRRVALAVEPFERGEALDAEALAEGFVLVGVDFGDGELRGRGLECGC